MAIHVQFDKHGWYHPAFGRLGRGDKARGTVYMLPDKFGEKDEKTGKFLMLPQTAVIIDSEELDEVLEELDQPKPVKPKVSDPDALEKTSAPGAGRRAKTQSAQERTAPKTQRRGSTKPKLS
jgi:hypothetical protein